MGPMTKAVASLGLGSALLIAAALTGAAVAGEGGDAGRYVNLPRTDDLPFSHAVLAGDTLYISGVLGLDPETGVPPQAIEEEARIAMGHIVARLEHVGMDTGDLVSVQVFCPDLELYETFNGIYRTYFEDGRYPARAFVGSGPLLRGAHFEITGIAVGE